MDEREERRQDYGELKSDVKHIAKTLDDFIAESKALRTIDADNRRDDQRTMWQELNIVKTDVSRMKGIGVVMHGVWTATIGAVIAYIWKH